MSNWEANYLRLHRTDTTGKEFTFAEISANDYIRIGAPGGTNAVFKIVSRNQLTELKYELLKGAHPRACIPVMDASKMQICQA